MRDMQLASLFTYEGSEFQIRQSKFGSEEWLVRLELQGARRRSTGRRSMASTSSCS